MASNDKLSSSSSAVAEQVGEDTWVLKDILDYSEGKYLILWKGNEQTWQPYTDVFDCPDLVHEFWKKKEKLGILPTRVVRKQLAEMDRYNQDLSSSSSYASSEVPFEPKKRKSSVDNAQSKRKRIESSSSDDDLDLSDYSEVSSITYHKRKRKQKRKMAEEDPGVPVDEILTWRQVGDKREFACRNEESSYHDIVWIPEADLQELSPAKYRNFVRKMADTPIPLKDSFDPSFLNVHKIMTVEEEELVQNDKVETFYMIKWENLSYLYKTFETNTNLPGFQVALQRYNLSLDCAQETLKRPPKQRSFSKLNVQPDFIPSNLVLKSHQLNGLNRILYNWSIHKSMILADEMGLGKTIQTISFLAFLYKNYKIGPFLIIVPNSTLDNWERECVKWAPFLSVLIFAGDREDRESIKSFEAFDGHHLRCHVLITTYSTMRIETKFIQKCGPFATLIVDESHNLKNERSLLYQCIDALNCDFTLFLTGTPVQNKARELFALLNVLDPTINVDALDNKYSNLTPNLVLELISFLKPFILRRTIHHIANELPPKKEVVVKCGMSKLQKQLYKATLEKNILLLNALDHQKQGLRTDVYMQLMRITMHPYAVDADIEPKHLSNEETLRLLISGSGKFQIAFQILDRLKADGHKVLIFAQHKRTLDLLQDILYLKQYKALRMDGDCNRLQRQSMFDQFNHTDVFCFIMTTRCGSEGINLTAADTVILMDVDYNPTVDKQAIGRCYRIGQTRRVLAIKLITTNTIDERRMEIANKKSTLNRLLVKPLDTEDVDVEQMMKYGTKQLFNAMEEDDPKLTNQQLEQYLDRSTATVDKVENEDDVFATNEHVQLTEIQVKENSIEINEEDDLFWQQLIQTKLKEEQLKQDDIVLGRGMRKKRKMVMVDNMEETDVKDDDFKVSSSSDEEEEEEEEQWMVGDLGKQRTMITQMAGTQRELLKKLNLLRSKPCGVKCWLCKGPYHHLMSCGVLRDQALLASKVGEFKQDQLYMIQRLIELQQ